jgi:hypothetical protein
VAGDHEPSLLGSNSSSKARLGAAAVLAFDGRKPSTMRVVQCVALCALHPSHRRGGVVATHRGHHPGARLPLPATPQP